MKKYFEKYFEKSAMVGGYFEKNPMTNKIKKFLYTLEHLIPDAHEEIPTFALYHPLTRTLQLKLNLLNCKVQQKNIRYISGLLRL